METCDPAAVLESLHHRRRSVRRFAADEVTESDLGRVTELLRPHPHAGWSTPSAHDLRPLRYLLVIGEASWTVPGIYSLDPDRPDSWRLLRGGDHRGLLREAVFDDQPWVEAAPLSLAILADLTGPTAEFRGQDDEDLRGRDFTLFEAGAAAQSIALSVAASGLGTVVVGGVREPTLRQVLHTELHVIALLPIGVPVH